VTERTPPHPQPLSPEYGGEGLSEQTPGCGVAIVIHQIEVRFSAPLREASLVDPNAPLPALAPVHPQPVVEVEPEPPPAPPQQSLWETEIGRQLAQDRETINTTLTHLTEVVRALDERHRQRLDEWRRAAVELGVAIAARLLHDKIQAGEMAVETMVREAIARLKPDEPVTVRLHPSDLALLQERLGGEPLLPGRANVQVVGDPRLGRGDCRAEGKDTSILVELGFQLAAMRQRLLEGLGHAQPGP
jgi:Flagellar assembly protein FliH